MPDANYPEQSAFRYGESRTDLSKIGRLEFDRNYRIAQLPLVSPGHPLAVEHEPGLDYVNGRYERERFSLVAPIPSETLIAAAGYAAFVADLAATGFDAKISHEIAQRRSDRLHATIVGGLNEADLADVAKRVDPFLHAHGPLRIRVLGPFVGAKNSGRIYLPIIPELVDGEQAFGKLQSSLGTPNTGFYAIGLFNFAEELTSAETRELSGVVDRWKDEILLEMSIQCLQIIGTHDDLALSGRRIADICS